MLLYVNTKNYAINNAATLKLLCQQIVELGLPVRLVVPAVMLGYLKEYAKILWVQHLDESDFGSHTGRNSVLLLDSSMCEGVLVNHAERPLDQAQILAVCTKAKAAGLKTMLCSEDLDFLLAFQKQEAACILAYEPKELIGGDISVVDVELDVLKRTVGGFEKPFVVGAGIKKASDLKASNELGAHGVLVASKVCKAEDPVAVMQELLSAL